MHLLRAREDVGHPSALPRWGPYPPRGTLNKLSLYWMQCPRTGPRDASGGPKAGPWPHTDGRMQG
eukprot:9258964-Pyramimonas_sp.AAC.1